MKERCYSLQRDYVLRVQPPHYSRLVNRRTDNSVDISTELFGLLTKCDGSQRTFGDEEILALAPFIEDSIIITDGGPLASWQVAVAEQDLLRRLDMAILYVTGKCNFNCKHCFFSTYRECSGLPTEAFRPIAEQLLNLGVTAVALTGGEILLRQDIEEICQILDENGLSIHLFSNGGLMNEAIIERLLRLPIARISVSLDGAKAETHNSFRRTDSFDHIIRMLRRLRDLRDARRFGKFVVSSAITLHNIKEVSLLYHMMRDDIKPDGWVLERPYKCGSFAEYGHELSCSTAQSQERFGELLLEIQRDCPEFPHRIHIDKYFHWLNPEKYVDVDLNAFYRSGAATGYACGNHLNHLYVLPTGEATWCVHTDVFSGIPGVSFQLVGADLATVWNSMEAFKQKLKFSNMPCGECIYLDLCGGGCRVIPMVENGCLLGCDEGSKAMVIHGLADGLYGG